MRRVRVPQSEIAASAWRPRARGVSSRHRATRGVDSIPCGDRSVGGMRDDWVAAVAAANAIAAAASQRTERHLASRGAGAAPLARRPADLRALHRRAIAARRRSAARAARLCPRQRSRSARGAGAARAPHRRRAGSAPRRRLRPRSPCRELGGEPAAAAARRARRRSRGRRARGRGAGPAQDSARRGAAGAPAARRRGARGAACCRPSFVSRKMPRSRRRASCWRKAILRSTRVRPTRSPAIRGRRARRTCALCSPTPIRGSRRGPSAACRKSAKAATQRASSRSSTCPRRAR